MATNPFFRYSTAEQRLVNDLTKTHDTNNRKEIVEDILLALDDIKGMTPEKFNEFEDGLKKYISEQ